MMSNTKNILLDLGAVLLNIDVNKLKPAFEDLGVKNFDLLQDQLIKADLFDNLETGKITPEVAARIVQDTKGGLGAFPIAGGAILNFAYPFGKKPELTANEEANIEDAPTQKLENTFTEFSNNSNNNSQKINGYQNKPNNIDNNNPYSIKDIIETKIENVKLQMELQQRNIELSNANAELTEYENEDNEIEEKPLFNLGEIIKNPAPIIAGIFMIVDGVE